MKQMERFVCVASACTSDVLPAPGAPWNRYERRHGTPCDA
jgi:hypothetical protein